MHLRAAQQRYISGLTDYQTLCEEIAEALVKDEQEQAALVEALAKLGRAFQPQSWAASLANAISQDILLERYVTHDDHLDPRQS